MAKQYRIRNVEDFAAVPDDKLVDCLHDFFAFLAFSRIAIDTIKEFPDLPEGSVQYKSNEFIWVDDGKRGISSVNFIDQSTNETVFSIGRESEDEK